MLGTERQLESSMADRRYQTSPAERRIARYDGLAGVCCLPLGIALNSKTWDGLDTELVVG